MEQVSSGEASMSSASHEYSRILGDSELYYRIHDGPPPLPVLRQINIVLPSTSRSSKLSICPRFA